MRRTARALRLLVVAAVALGGCRRPLEPLLPPLAATEISGARLWQRITTESDFDRWAFWPGHEGMRPGQSPHGRCLVNGTLVFSIVVGMSVRDISQTAIADLEYESVRHLGPTFHGDTLYAESEILEKIESQSTADRGVLGVETRAWNQRNEPVMSLRRRVMLPRRAAKG